MTNNYNEIIDRSNTGAIKLEARKSVFGIEDVMPMWVADMEFRSPQCVIDALDKRLQHGIFGYTFRMEGFYSAILRWLEKRHQWCIDRNWILFSPGVVPALNFSVKAFTAPGDKIIVQPPVYYPFYSAIKDHDREVVLNPLKLKEGKYHMDFAGLEKKIDEKVKMILLCSPHNPGGMVWSEKTLRKLCDVCIENDIIIISDEIHADLVFNGNKHIPTASLSDEIADRVVTLMSPSKTFNLAGFSTAYAIIKNDTLRNKFDAVLRKHHIHHGNIFGNVALEAAYNDGEQWLEALLQYLTHNITIVENFLNKHIPQIKMIRPEATYLIWLDCRALDTGKMKLNDFFVHKAKLGLSEGRIFGREGTGFMRMNIGCPEKMIISALKRIKAAVDEKEGAS